MNSDYRIMGLCILIAFLEYILLRLFSKRRTSELASITLEKSNILQFVNEEFDGAHEIHTFDLNATFIEKIKKHLIKLNSHIHWYNALNCTRLSISMFYIQCIAEVVLLVVGVYLASLKIIIFANIMIAIQLSDQIEQMIVALASFKIFVDEYAVYEKRVYEIIDLKGQKFTYKEKKNALLALDHVCFSYDKEEVLHDITLDIKKDKKIAIVGESGSGKSTILKLLLNLYEPTSGNVYQIIFR